MEGDIFWGHITEHILCEGEVWLGCDGGEGIQQGVVLLLHITVDDIGGGQFFRWGEGQEVGMVRGGGIEHGFFERVSV